MKEKRALSAALRRVIPFRALPPEELDRLAEDASVLRVPAGTILARQDQPEDRRVFLLVEGEIEIVDLRGPLPVRLNVITPGHYFGETPALFDAPREGSAHTLEPSVLLAISGERFLRLLESSAAFAQALAGILRIKQGVFQNLDNFLAELLYGVSLGTISLFRLTPLYLKMEPALHPRAGDGGTIDFSALMYAIRRLPENITRTFMLFLTDDLPALYAPPQASFEAIPTAARPRSTYELVPGKGMILLRDGLSDLVDLVSCICLYAVEARKIRKRLGDARHMHALHAYLEVGRARTARDDRDFLQSLPLADFEVDSFQRVWPERPVARLREILLQHEDLGITVRKQLQNYNSRPAEAWAAQIAADVAELIGYDPGELPPDYSVHIISSNTHSVTNCLSTYLAELAHRERILTWGQSRDEPLCRQDWADPLDLLYALSRRYLAAHPEERARKIIVEREQGVLRRYETAFTGIQVELIDVGKLAASGRPIDPGVAVPGESPSLIVNIDFAFGQQAREIIASLVLLFARNLRSINVLGKAGALRGRRGDILAPTAFIEQQADLYEPLPEVMPIDRARLVARGGVRDIHEGPMLTVLGTLMQNRRLLNYYRRVWRCVGLEMEGYFYFRHIAESIRLGVLPADLPLRFLYYVSDTPLETGGTLSESLTAWEGIPPLYAVTREILSSIFEQDRARAAGG
jgi:hypothetical protein